MLARLSAPAFERLRPHLEPIELPLGTRIYEEGSCEDSLYFVSAGIASLLKVSASGPAVETAIVGSEGVLGVEIFTGGSVSGWRVVAQSALRGFRLGTEALHRELAAAGGELEPLLLRFTEALMHQVSQRALCNRRHSIEQQVCCGLLASLDRLGARELMFTQMLMADMLGVRREGVSTAAAKLQADGLIRYAHGRIAVLRRDALESRACECYAAVRAAYRPILEGAVA